MSSHHRSRPSNQPTARGWQGRRIGLLIATAALGALGYGLISPGAATATTSPNAAVQDAAFLSPDQVRELNDPDLEKSDQRAPGASAVVQAQARAQALAADAARRTADAAAAAAAAAAAHQASDAGSAGAGSYQDYAMAKVGAAQFACLDKLWNRESHWQPTAKNPSSTAYGIAQLLNSTWSVTGVAKTSNGYRQVDAGLAYLRAAYPAGPCSAWAHETSAGWY